jgi:hypothetical protein
MNSFSRSILARSLVTGAAAMALMVTSTGARAQVVGASGMNGADCFTDGCTAGNGTDGESVTAGWAVGGNGGNGGNAFNVSGFGTTGWGGNGGSASASGTTATAFGGAGGAVGNFLYNGFIGLAGNGGDATATSGATSSGSSNAISAATAIGGADGEGLSEGGIILGAGAGGNATATSSAAANGSGNATSSATATGGAGNGDVESEAGSATATSSATANGSGGATASATATEGFGFSAFPNPSNATSYAETAKGGLAQAQVQAQVQVQGFEGESQSTAKTTFGAVSVQSTVESLGGTTNAIAQGGSGQPLANPEQAFAFSTALPNIAYATTLIGSASNVANALLEPGDKIFGTVILGDGDSSSTLDFSFRGDLILGVIAGTFLEIVVNGNDILSEAVGDNSVINLGSILGPTIDLTIEGGGGVFALGGAVPEPSTWALMLLGFAGLGFAGYRSTRKTEAVGPRP